MRHGGDSTALKVGHQSFYRVTPRDLVSLGTANEHGNFGQGRQATEELGTLAIHNEENRLAVENAVFLLVCQKEAVDVDNHGSQELQREEGDEEFGVVAHGQGNVRPFLDAVLLTEHVGENSRLVARLGVLFIGNRANHFSSIRISSNK